MKKITLISFILLSCFLSVQAQTGSTLAEMYGAKRSIIQITDHLTESYKHMAMIKEGDSFTVLEAVNGHGQGGFQLSRFKSSGFLNSAFTAGKPATTVWPTKYMLRQDYNTFVKTDYGYVACGPNILAVFGKDLEPINVTSHPGYALLSAAPLAGTSQIAMLEVNIANHGIYIGIYDYKIGRSVIDYQPILQGNEWMHLSAQCNRLIQTPEGQLFIALNQGHDIDAFHNPSWIFEMGGDEPEKQIFGKIDLAKLKGGAGVDEFLLWQKMYPVRLVELQINAESQMEAVIRMKGDNSEEEKLQFVTADTKISTAEEFNASIAHSTTEGWNDSPVQGMIVRRLPDGRFVAIGRGRKEFGLQWAISIVLYSKYMEVERQYTYTDYLPGTQLGQGVDGTATAPRQLADLVIEPDAEMDNMGLDCKLEPHLRDEAEVSNAYFFGHCSVWDVLPGFTKDDIIILNAHQIIKLSLTDYEEYTNRWDE